MLAAFLNVAVTAGESDLAGIFRKELCDEIHHICSLTPAVFGDLLK
jgi:hypothetical protein